MASFRTGWRSFFRGWLAGNESKGYVSTDFGNIQGGGKDALQGGGRGLYLLVVLVIGLEFLHATQSAKRKICMHRSQNSAGGG